MGWIDEWVDGCCVCVCVVMDGWMDVVVVMD